MKLSVLERLMLMGVLPREGNFATLKIVRDLQAELSFSEAEFKKYKIIQEGESIRWDDKADRDMKDIKIGEKASDLIIESLKKLDEQKKLTPQHFSLFERFVEKKKEE